MEIFTPPEVRPKRTPGRRSKHSESYQMVVAKKMIDEGISYREAASTYGLSHGSISNIIRKYRDGKLNLKRKETTSKYAKEVESYRVKTVMNDLKLEIANLFLENLMLKKMLEVSRQMKKENSSVITSENLDLLPERAK